MRKTTPPVAVIVPARRRRLSTAARKKLLALRDAWLRQIDPADLFRLFDTMPGVQFFAKNRQGKVMFWCEAVRKMYQIEDEAAVLGLTNSDVAPADMALVYSQGDAQIYATNKPLLNHVELVFDSQGVPDWFLVNKIPVHSRTGEILGIMGFSQNYESRAQLLPPFHGVSKVVNYLRQNYQQEVSIHEVSQIAGLSERQLERRFKAHFGMGPQQFLIRTRLLAACRRLMETDQTLGEIAYGCGFSTQSAFAHHFRQHLGMTPREFRRRQLAA